MSTTTIRMPQDLKARVAEAAALTGQTPHSFILDAIAEKAADVERRSKFAALADERLAQVAETGMTVAWEDVRRYLVDRVDGKKPRRPVGRKLR